MNKRALGKGSLTSLGKGLTKGPSNSQQDTAFLKKTARERQSLKRKKKQKGRLWGLSGSAMLLKAWTILCFFFTAGRPATPPSPKGWPLLSLLAPANELHVLLSLLLSYCLSFTSSNPKTATNRLNICYPSRNVCQPGMGHSLHTAGHRNGQARALQRWILNVLRNLLGVKTIIPSWSILRECGIEPFSSTGFVQLCVSTTCSL
eukprot:1158048-Pelagomonas_calceolata.AAC.24